MNLLPIIRQVEAGDLRAVSEIDQAIFGPLAYPYFVIRQLFDVHQGEMLALDDGERLLGYSIAVHSTTAGLGWFLSLGVMPEARGAGNGGRLARASLRELRRRGVERVLLSVKQTNIPAMRLYRRLGFTAVGEVDDYLGPGEGRQLLELDMRAGAWNRDGRIEVGGRLC